jgi:hypothetical protein
MTVPVQKVEFGFTQSSPGVYVYQDITSYVRSVSISRGVSRELDSYQAGSCSIILDNNSRTFDPSYAAGPFYGEIKPQAAVRVTSGNVVIFTGFVESWSFNYQIVADATATVSAVDAISRLSRAALPAVSWTSESTSTRVGKVLDRAEVAWPAAQRQISTGSITLGADSVSDGISAWDYLSQVAQTEGGAIYVSGSGDVVFKGQAASLVPTSGTAIRTNLCIFPSFESATLSSAGNTWTGVTRTTAVSPPSVGRTNVALCSAGGATYNAARTFAVNIANTFSFYVYVVGAGATITGSIAYYNETTPTGTATNSQSISSGTWTRVTVTGAPTGASTKGVFTVTTSRADLTYYIDAVMVEQSAAADIYFDGIYKPADTATTVYTNAWTGSADVSASTLTAVTTYTPGVPNSIQFSDAGGTAIPYVDVSVVYAGETLYNSVTVGGTAGTAVLTNSTGGSAYGIRAYTLDPSLVADNANGSALARYLLGLYDTPQLRFDSLTVALEALQSSDQSNLLGSEIYSAASVTYTPSAIGSAITVYERIVGINHTITPDTHHVTFNLAEFGNKFRLDSLTLGVLNTNILGY